MMNNYIATDLKCAQKRVATNTPLEVSGAIKVFVPSTSRVLKAVSDCLEKYSLAPALAARDKAAIDYACATLRKPSLFFRSTDYTFQGVAIDLAITKRLIEPFYLKDFVDNYFASNFLPNKLPFDFYQEQSCNMLEDFFEYFASTFLFDSPASSFAYIRFVESIHKEGYQFVLENDVPDIPILIGISGFNENFPDFVHSLVPAPRLVGIEPNPGPPSCSKERQPSFHYDAPFVPQVFGFDLGTQSFIDSVNNLAASISQVANKADQIHVEHEVSITAPFAGVIQSILDRFPAIKECKYLFLIIASWLVARWLGKNCEAGTLHTVSQLALASFSGYCAYQGTDQAMAYITEIFSDNVRDSSEEDEPLEMHPQSGSQNVVQIILAYIYGESAIRSKDKGCITAFLKTCADMPKIEDGLYKLVDYVLTVAQKFADYLSTMAGVDPWTIKTSMFPELDLVHKDLSSLIDEFRAGAPYSYDNAMRLFEIEKRVSTIVAKIPNTREFVEYKKSALSLVATIKPFVGKMERNNIVGNGPRRDPLAIMLGGPTAVGKSTSIFPLILAVNSLVLPEEKLEGFMKNHNDYIWNFVAENPFADSYHGQFNTVIDEAGAQRDAAGTPDPGALAALRMINTANYPLHMAHLEDKGNSNFNSEIVWATTNRTFFDWKSMYLPEAYARRFKLSFLHVPKLEYCVEGSVTDNLWDRRLDMSKIPYTEEGFDMEINEFYPYDFRPASAGVKGPPIGFEELILLIAKSYKDHKAHADKLLNFHPTIKQRYMNMRKGFEPQGNFESAVEAASRIYDISTEMVERVNAKYNLAAVHGKVYYDEFWSKYCQEACEVLSVGRDSWYSTIKSFFVDNKFLSAILVSIPVAIMVWKFIGPVLFPQSGDVKAKARTKQKGHRPKSSKDFRTTRVDPTTLSAEQGGISQNCWDMANKIVKRNMYQITCENRELGFFTFLIGKFGVLPEHFLFAIDAWIEEGLVRANPKIMFRRVGAPESGFEIFKDDISFMYVDDRVDDVCYALLPSVSFNHCDITNYLLDENDKSVYNRFNCALLRPDGNGSFGLAADMAAPIGSQSYHGYSFDSGFTYPIATRSGECGSPLFVMKHGGAPRLAGIHVAGNNKSGMATRLDKKTIMSVIGNFPTTTIQQLPEIADSEVQIGNKFLTCNEVAKLRTSTVSKVVPSPLHGKWGPSDFEPAVLVPTMRDGTMVDPWRIARNKYSGVSAAMNMAILDCVSEQTIQEMFHVSKMSSPWPARLLTFEEAVCGVEGVPFVDGIPRGTSAGYPFNLYTKGKGKSDWFGSEGPVDFAKPSCVELMSHIEVLRARISKGERIDVLFADYLKDERRRKAKVESCSTRLISASPMDFLILCKIYFGDIVRWLMDNRIDNGMCIGINPYGHEWTHLARHLQSIGDNMIFGDYSGFDASLSCTLMYKFLSLCDAFYVGAPEEDKLARRALFEDIVNSRHVYGNGHDPVSLAYEWFGSNPSGNALTTPLNSFCNILIIKYAIVATLGFKDGYEHDELPYQLYSKYISEMSENLRVATFGDDNGFSVSDSWKPHIDQKTITESMATFGFKYTNESKNDETHTHRKISECSFLKRGFVFDKGSRLFAAPLELAVILEMPYWTKSDAPPGSVESTVDTSLMELSIHGPRIFAKHSQAIIENSILATGHKPNGNYFYNRGIADSAEMTY